MILQRVINRLVQLCACCLTLCCILWNLDVPTRLGFAILTEQFLALMLGLSLAVVFLSTPFFKRQDHTLRPANMALAILALLTLGYCAASYVYLLNEVAFRPPILTFIGAVTVLLTLEGVRRRSGWTLFILVGLFIVYALCAHRVSGPLVGREISFVQLVQYIGFDPSAVYGTPLKVGATIVVLFVFFGGLLFKAGGGEFFTDLALATTGKTRGGAAKISVIASALFGSISGSAVSNVATTGVITIPLMRRGGYSATDAGAVEAIASTGGQLTPPIMGAAAFLMAEFLEVSYLSVMIAAIIPALLYYFSVFVQVDLIAARDRIAFVGQEVPRLADVLRRGWHLLLPFAVLLYALFALNLDPEDAALLAALAIVIAGSLRAYNGRRLTARQLLATLVETGLNTVELILIVAAAGFVIGILNITGLGFALTLLLVDLVGANLPLLLLMAAAVCILLGMGMPTSGVYVLLAALVAPALVEAGVTPMAAHLFILYFGMMSMITPPIALAAFAAAAISKAGAMQTGFAAMRIGWVAYLIPFLFVGSNGLLLQNDITIGAVAIEVLKALLGIFAVSLALTGYFGRRRGPLLRFGYALLGLACMPLELAPPLWPLLNLAAAAILMFLLAVQWRQAATLSRPPP